MEKKMASYNGRTPSVNVVTPISPISEKAQEKSSLLPPDAPAELIAALSKEIELFDMFTEPFGTVNQYGETVLFEAPIHIIINEKRTWSFGNISIIFYPEICKILLIVEENSSNNLYGRYEFLGNEKDFKYRLNRRLTIPAGKFFPEREIVFASDKEFIQFKREVRNIHVRISKNRIPPKVLPENKNSCMVSELRFLSGLRPSHTKILCVHKGNIWMAGNSETDEMEYRGYGILGLAKTVNGDKDKSETLGMIIIAPNSTGHWIPDYFTIPGYFALTVSDISSDKDEFIWEWFGSAAEQVACSFATAKEALAFKTVIDYYVTLEAK